MSISPPLSPLVQYTLQESVPLTNISHDRLPNWKYWSSINTSHASQSSRTSSPNTQPPRSPTLTPSLETHESLNPPPPKTQSWTQALKPWSPELLSLILATTVLCIVTIGLRVLNNKPLSAWSLPISLNAAVSALIVATKACVVYSTASCLGQLKWLHFSHAGATARFLYDFKVFDEASKGPLGAVKLVCRSRYASLTAVMGGIIVAAAVCMEVFGQQVLAFEDRRVVGEGQRAAFAVTQHLAAQEQWYLDYTVMSELQKVLLAAIFRGKQEVEFECGAAECTWPASATLGICSDCRDITGLSQGNCEGDAKNLECLYQIPGFGALGGSVEIGGPMPLINTTTLDGVYDATPSFYNFSTLVVAESTNWTAKLTSCELSWCAWTYENASSQGTSLDLGTPLQFPLQLIGTWERINVTLNLDDTQSVCVAIGDYPANLNNTFTISQGKEYFLKYAVRLILKAGYQGADFYTQLTLATSSLDYTDTAAMSSNLAAFMTNALRTQDGLQATGTAWQSVTFIKVRWAWLVLPAVLVLAAGALLFLTIVQSRRHDTVLWKTSLLAFLFCSTHAWTMPSDRQDKARSLRAMEAASKKMEARLERDDQGQYQLVQI